MAKDVLNGKNLRQAIAEYGSGDYSKKPLSELTKKDRRLLGENLTKYFNKNGWLFSEQTARKWIESKKKYNPEGILINKSSSSRYIAQIRAFNHFCIERRYLTINFCQWIAKPPETLKPHLDLSHETLLHAIELGTKKGNGDRARSIRIKKEGYAALTFMLFTSRRSGEMVKLQGSDIHVNATEPKYFAHLKGGKCLDFPIPENLLGMMKERQHKKRVFEVTPATTIDYLQKGLIKAGVPEQIATEADNHTLRKAFAKERYRNGDSVEEIADAMADTVEVVRKHYLGRDLKKLRNTVNNTKAAKESINAGEIIRNIRNYIKTITNNDNRFNPLAAEEALDIKKLLNTQH